MALKLKQKMLGGRRNSVDARRLCAFDVSSAFQRVKYLCLIQKKKKTIDYRTRQNANYFFATSGTDNRNWKTMKEQKKRRYGKKKNAHMSWRQRKQLHSFVTELEFEENKNVNTMIEGKQA